MTKANPKNWNPLAGIALHNRADMMKALCNLAAPLEDYRSPGKARIRLSEAAASFDKSASDLEGFARPLWGLAAAAAGGNIVTDWSIWRQGLANGCNPDHSEYWGRPGDLDQRLVELAAIGFALMVAKDQLWDPLSQTEKSGIVKFLRDATQCRFSDNNWVFFRLLIDAGLRAVGVNISMSVGAAERTAIDALYLGDGWYRDGPGRRVDHYVGFAFHTYGLLLHRFAPSSATEIYLERARKFAPQFAAWFDDKGRCLPFGRSMTYRFAMCSFFGAYALADPDPVLPYGVLKGIILRHIRWWAEQPMADRDGILSVGYAYPNPHMAEEYNSAGSPYWALKAFLPLALADDHPFWTEKEEPLPELPKAVMTQMQPGFLLQKRPNNTVALAAGQEAQNFRHGDEKYAKFAYSTCSGFSVEIRDAKLDEAVLDSMLGLQAEGRPWTRRRGCIDAFIAEAAVYARWNPYEDVEVETLVRPWGEGHLRMHRIVTPVPLYTIEGGFCIERREGIVDEQIVSDTDATIRSTGVSMIRDIGSFRRKPRIHGPASNTNLMTARTWLPQLIGQIPEGSTQIACYCVASSDLQCVLPSVEAPMHSHDWPSPPEHPWKLISAMSGAAGR